VTIPKQVRDTLRAKPGDVLEYEVQGKVVTLRLLEPFDREFHGSLSITLSEWSSPEDEEAFRDL
jgi:antitoxin PrlF